MRLPRKTIASTAALSALLLTAACGGSDDPADAAESTSDTATSAPADTESDSPDASSGEYADGTYEAEGSYSNPGGTSSVSVSLTLADGKVSKVEVTPEASGTSLQYQQKFASGIADEVVGKSLDEIKVDKVSGSSLTSGGFNEALDQIKSDAQS